MDLDEAQKYRSCLARKLTILRKINRRLAFIFLKLVRRTKKYNIAKEVKMRKN